MIDPLHPLRDVIDRHWPIAPTSDPAAADIRRRTIDDLIEDLDNVTWGAHGCTCSCEACEDCVGSDW